MITGLEVGGLVAAIVSALSQATQAYQGWRDARRGRKGREDNERLQDVVSTSSELIQQEYAENFRRLGEAFARGDGMHEKSPNTKNAMLNFGH